MFKRKHLVHIIFCNDYNYCLSRMNVGCENDLGKIIFSILSVTRGILSTFFKRMEGT